MPSSIRTRQFALVFAVRNQIFGKLGESWDVAVGLRFPLFTVTVPIHRWLATKLIEAFALTVHVPIKDLQPVPPCFLPLRGEIQLRWTFHRVDSGDTGRLLALVAVFVPRIHRYPAAFNDIHVHGLTCIPLGEIPLQVSPRAVP
jgi:hypothetical protein